MEFLKVREYDEKLYYSLYTQDGFVRKGVADNSEGAVNLFDNYYFDMNEGVYKLVDDNREFLFLNSNITDIQIKVDDENFVINGNFYPKFYFEDGTVIENVVIDDESYNFEIMFFNSEYFVRCFDSQGKFVFVDVYKQSGIDSIHQHIESVFSGLFDFLGELPGQINDIKISVTDKIDERYQSLNTLVSDDYSSIISLINDIGEQLTNKEIDFTPVIVKLDDIETKVENVSVDLSPVNENISNLENLIDTKLLNLKQIFDISNIIDEKLENYLNLKSLNGSNGSKFVDGSKVQVDGYIGEWEVVGSYPLLNADNIVIIVYSLKQDGKLLLAPAPLVKAL